jgi:uncharacterized protein
MKYLLVLLVLVVAGFLFFGRRRPPPTPPAAPDRTPAKATQDRQETQVMLACAHCGVHLPQADARLDAAGRPYCSDAHRLLGPR